MIKYLNKIHPDAIISGSDLRVSDRVLFSWSKKNRVPFIILQPSFLEGAFPERYGLKKITKYFLINKIFGIPLHRKFNLYGNESQKSYLFLWGKHFIQNPNRNRMIITGNPVFDKFFKSVIPLDRKVKKKVLICTQPSLDLIYGQNTQKKVNDIYIEAIKSKPGIEFYIKVHPREDIENYTKIFPRSRFPNVKVCKNIDLYELFKLCAVQISVSSYTSIEAAAMGLPVIILIPQKKTKFPDHFKGEIEIRVSEVDEIESAINLALSEEYWNKFLVKRERYFKKIFNFTDGKNAKRIATVIKRIIRKQPFKDVV